MQLSFFCKQDVYCSGRRWLTLLDNFDLILCIFHQVKRFCGEGMLLLSEGARGVLA